MYAFVFLGVKIHLHIPLMRGQGSMLVIKRILGNKPNLSLVPESKSEVFRNS